MEILMIIWFAVNLIAFISLCERHFEFGDKRNFSLRGKAIWEILVEYIVFMPILVICIVVMIFNWTPFSEK